MAIEDLGQSLEDPVIFCSLAAGEVARQWYAVTQLPDDATYYGGWKEDRLLEISDVRRSLSGPDLAYQVGSFRLMLADEDYAIRSLLAESAPYYSTWELEAYIVSPSGRLAEVDALPLATGIVDSDPEFDDVGVAMSVRFTCRDRIGIAMGWTSTGQAKVPRRVLNNTTLPGVVASVQGLGAPVPLGTLSNAPVIPSGFGPPIPSGIAAYGGTFDSGYWRGGFAPWTATVAAVTGLSLGTAAGGACPERDFAIQIFPVNADGDVGDPNPYLVGTVTTTVTSPNLTITASWVASPDAVAYYAVLYADYFGWRPQQIIETAGTSVAFDAAFDTPNPGSGFATGAVEVPDTPFFYYTARSKAGNIPSAWADGGTFDSTGAIFASSITLPHGKTRPVRVWFTPVGSASYEVKKTASGPAEPIIFPLLASQLQAGALYFDDDFTNAGGIAAPRVTDRPVGRVKGLYSRDVMLFGEDWREILIAGIAIKSLDDWYYDPGGESGVADVEVNQDDGTAFLFPVAGTAWDSYFPTPYRDIDGADGITRRYTLGYARGHRGDLLASGTAKISFNLCGAETLGDGSGDLITDYHDQFQYILNRHILASGEGYTTGLYGPVPTQGLELLPIVDADSFDVVKAMREDELVGGMVGAGVMGALGELVDVATEIQRWCIGGDLRIGPSRLWQIKAAAIDENLEPVYGITTDVSDEFDIHARTFKPMPRLAELENAFQYEYLRDYVEGGFSIANQTFRNQNSIDRWRLIKQGATFSFYYLEDDAAVDLILDRHVSRRSNAPMYVTGEIGLAGMGAAYDIGEYFKLRHWRGVADGGWTDRVMWIVSHTFLPGPKRVRLECLDVTDLLGNASYYALLEEAMDIELGGSWYHSPTIDASPVTVDAFEYWDKRVSWENLPAGTIVEALVWGVVPSGASMVAELYDPEDLAVVATDPTPFTNTSSIDLHTFAIPTEVAAATYRLRATVTGASGQGVILKGLLRTTLP